jgi:hypothetical protein
MSAEINPFAASLDDGLAYDGDTEDAAIGEAVEAWIEQDERDGDDLEWPVDLSGEVYRDVVWCDGDCEDCGSEGEDGSRCMVSRGGRRWVRVRVYHPDDLRGWELLPAEVPRG